jgi:hypothetical protein
MNKYIMKQLSNKFLQILILSSLGFSCSITIPRAINENPIGNTIGKSTQTTYLGIFSVGEDASIEQAARNGNLKTISTVDYQITNFLGLVSKQTVIVTGSQTLEEPAASSNPETSTTQASINESEKKDVIVSSTQNSITPGNIVPETKKEIVVKNETTKPIQAPANTFVEPIVKPQNEVTASKNTISSKEAKRIEIANEDVSPENKDTNKRIEGFSIKAKSLSDFSKKIKETSSEYMQFGDLTPIDIKLNLTTLTFSCNFIQKTSGLIKLGLFYGPKSLGCESCESVIINNPGSKVLAKSSNAIFVSQLIGVYSN